jgi:hypothetical protein
VAALTRLCWPVDYDRAAWQLDRVRGDVRDRLRSAVDFARRGITGQVFARWSEEAAVAAWKDVGAARFARRGPALRLALGAVAFAVAVAAVARVPDVRARLLWQRLLAPLGNHMRPTATWFEVVPPPAEPLRGGDDYVLRARLRGRPVEAPLPMARITAADGTATTRKLMPVGADTWQLPLTDLRQDIEFVLVMDRVRSARHALRVLPRPTVSAIEVTYDYPRYTNLRRKKETLAGRTIAALEGTKVRIDITCNIPLREASGRIGDDLRRFVVSARDPHRATCYLFLAANGTLALHLVGQNELESLREAPLQLRVALDAPPTVSLVGQWEQREYDATEFLDVSYRAQDDLGLMEVALKSGEFEQEADLESYGAKETQGVMRVPVALLMKPGEATARFRILARDGKGQAAVSREVKLRIAVDSYDRQLRLARNSLLGTPDIRQLATCGYPMLARSQARLDALRLLQTRLGALAEALAEHAKPGPAEGRIMGDIRDSLARVQPSFQWLYTPWDGGVFAWVARMPLLPRLQTLVRDTLAAELALNAPELDAAVARALADANPKAALGQVVPRVEAAIAVQEDVTCRLSLMRHLISVELAGCLAENLLAAMRPADAPLWRTQDNLLSAHASLRECVNLAGADPALALPPALVEELQAAVGLDTPAAALKAAMPALTALAEQLRAAAHRLRLDDGAWRMPVAEYAAANRPRTAAWLDCHAAWALMQASGRDADPLDRLNAALQHLQWRLQPDGASRPVGSPDAAVRARHEAAFRLGLTLGALRAEMEALRLGVLNGYLTPGKPEFEGAWVRLREACYALLAFADAPAVDAAIRRDLTGLTGQLDAFRHWTSPERDPIALGATLARLEAPAAALAARVAPAARDALRAIESDLNARRGILGAGIAAYRRDIGQRIDELGRLTDIVDDEHFSKRRGAVFGPMWGMRARLLMLDLACRETLGMAEAARIHHAGDSVNLESLVLGSLFLKRALSHFHGKVLPMEDPIRLITAIKGGDMSGKVSDYRELDRLLGEAATALDAALTPATAAQRAAENQLAVAFDREQKALQQALGAEAALADGPGVLAAILSERTLAPAVWGRVGAELADVRERLRSGREDEAAQAAARSLAAAVRRLEPLPRSLQALPEALAGVARDIASPEPRQRLVEDLDSLLADLSALAQPPPAPPGREAAQADLLAVARARTALALGSDRLDRSPLHRALAVMEWHRRRDTQAEGRLGIGGLALGAGEDMENLKLPRHLYLELKRAREQAMPELFRDRSYQYLNTLMEQAR